MNNNIGSSSEVTADIRLEFDRFLGIEHLNPQTQNALIHAFVLWYVETHPVTFSVAVTGIKISNATYRGVRDILEAKCNKDPKHRGRVLERFLPVRKKVLGKLPLKSVVHVGGTPTHKKPRGAPPSKLLALR